MLRAIDINRFSLIIIIILFFGKLFFHPRHLPTPTIHTHTHHLRPLSTTLLVAGGARSHSSEQ